MRASRLALEDFRNCGTADVPLAAGVTAFVGPNGAGKTNLLEALHLVARGDSPRARDDTDLVRWGASVSRVGADVERAEDHRRVELLLFGVTASERRRPRRYLVDGVGRRADEAVGELKVVAFFPEDTELLAAAPSARRRYLDAMIAQVDRAHRRDVREYARVVEQRNGLLRAFRDEGEAAEDEMAFWDTELCRLAAVISRRRIRAVAELRPAFHRAVTLFAGTDALEVAYATAVLGDGVEERGAGYQRLVAEKRERERWQATTLVGPHREDLAVTGDERALPTFASRGEQRSAVLALKLAEATWLREQSGDLPVFLLDDVLSELDTPHREALARAIPDGAQALLTAAVRASLPDALAERAAIVPVQPGVVG